MNKIIALAISMMILLMASALAVDYSAWNHCINISITNPGEVLKATINKSNYANLTSANLRFSDASCSNGNEMPYWIDKEYWDANDMNDVYINISSASEVFMHYDNPYSTDIYNLTGVAVCGDEFNRANANSIGYSSCGNVWTMECGNNNYIYGITGYYLCAIENNKLRFMTEDYVANMIYLVIPELKDNYAFAVREMWNFTQSGDIRQWISSGMCGSMTCTTFKTLTYRGYNDINANVHNGISAYGINEFEDDTYHNLNYIFDDSIPEMYIFYDNILNATLSYTDTNKPDYFAISNTNGEAYPPVYTHFIDWIFFYNTNFNTTYILEETTATTTTTTTTSTTTTTTTSSTIPAGMVATIPQGTLNILNLFGFIMSAIIILGVIGMVRTAESSYDMVVYMAVGTIAVVVVILFVVAVGG